MTNKYLLFRASQNELIWDDVRYEAISGPHGKGQLPDGVYEILVRNSFESSELKDSYRDPLTGLAFFIPVVPMFDTVRHGFGIHPDGNVPGTLGCVGLQESASARFWRRWKQTHIQNRPDILHVESRTQKINPMIWFPTQELYDIL